MFRITRTEHVKPHESFIAFCAANGSQHVFLTFPFLSFPFLFLFLSFPQQQEEKVILSTDDMDPTDPLSTQWGGLII